MNHADDCEYTHPFRSDIAYATSLRRSGTVSEVAAHPEAEIAAAVCDDLLNRRRRRLTTSSPIRAQAEGRARIRGRHRAQRDGWGLLINGKTDTLRGLKENVIMVRLIPAGTGLAAYKSLNLIVEGEIVENEQARYAPAPPVPQPPPSLSAVNEE